MEVIKKKKKKQCIKDEPEKEDRWEKKKKNPKIKHMKTSLNKYSLLTIATIAIQTQW